VNQRPNSYLSPRLIGLDCPEKGGRGVYARVRISRGEILVVFGGDVVPGEVLAELGSAARRFTLQVDEDAYLVSTRIGPADWVNHSCDPNAGVQGQITLVALREIEPGEEICFDYAMSDGTCYDEFDCQCGSSRCRGRVTGDDWRLPELRDRYRGYFSTFLEQRVETLEREERARDRARLRAAAGGPAAPVRRRSRRPAAVPAAPALSR
jgi:hypothetical protein